MKYKPLISILKGASITILTFAAEIILQIIVENPSISITEAIVVALVVGGARYGNNYLKQKTSIDFKGKITKYLKYV